jgi:hypothetical protein
MNQFQRFQLGDGSVWLAIKDMSRYDLFIGFHRLIVRLK